MHFCNTKVSGGVITSYVQHGEYIHIISFNVLSINTDNSIQHLYTKHIDCLAYFKLAGGFVYYICVKYQLINTYATNGTSTFAYTCMSKTRVQYTLKMA